MAKEEPLDEIIELHLEVQEFEKQFYQEMSEYLGNGEHADHDQESKNFHLVENY